MGPSLCPERYSIGKCIVALESAAGADIALFAMCAGDCVSGTPRSRPVGQSWQVARAYYRRVTIPIYISSDDKAGGKER
jgi:hypothetical protein